MLHADIANFSRMARNHAGYLDYGPHDSVFSWKQEMSAILGHDTATKIVEQKEREEAMESLRLHYDYENMTLNTKDCCRAEVKQTLDVIADRQPQLQLYHTKGETYWEFKGKKEDVKQVDIYRLQAPDGYCFDYEHDLMENENGVKHKTAHVKFIVQKDENTDIRKAAVGKLTDQTLLANIAINDKIYSVAKIAIDNIKDESLLSNIAEKAKCADIRALAENLLSKSRLTSKPVNDIAEDLILKLDDEYYVESVGKALFEKEMNVLLMRKVYDIVAKISGGLTARKLEVIWDDIGNGNSIGYDIWKA